LKKENQLSAPRMRRREWLLNMIFMFIFGITILICLGLVSASIETLGTFKQNDCITLRQNCANCTYANVTSITYPNSTYFILGHYPMTQNGLNYYYDICNASSVLGEYVYCTEQDNDNLITTSCINYFITTTGNANSLTGILFYIGSIVVLFFFLGLCMFSFFKFDNLLNRVGMIGLTYLFLIAISFVAWQMATDFLTNASFVTDMMQIIFYVLIIGMFPLVIGGFAWYVIMVLRIKEINKLIEKGFSLEEAENRTSRRH
jgi:hypothetical protein